MSDIPFAVALSEKPPPKRRYAILGLILSLLSVGLGQLYVGRTKRGWAFSIMVGATILILAIVLHTRPRWTLLPLVLVLVVFELGTWLYGGIDAALIARRQRTIDGQARPGWRAYVLLIVVNIALSAITNAAFKHIAWRSFTIPSASMQPTLRVGDFFMVWRQYFSDHEPQRGDIATILMPQMGNTTYVKRIVGLPGDRVQLRDGRLFLNDEEVAAEAGPASDRMLDYGRSLSPFVETLPGGRRYEIGRTERNHTNDDTLVFVVPAHAYFVLGDNRNNSMDSRMREVGFVPRENLQDLALFVFWARDWRRIGQTLD